MVPARATRWNDIGRRAVGALSRRSGRGCALGAGELMAARVDQLRELPRVPRSFSVRVAEPGDTGLLRDFLGNETRVAKLVASGDVGLLAIAEGRVQAMEWLRPGPAEYDWDAIRLGVVFKVPARFCWLHNGAGSGGGGETGVLGPWAMILGRLPDFLRQRGLEVACLQVAYGDGYSVRCHRSLGFSSVGHVAALRVGRTRLVGLRLRGGKWRRVGAGQLDLQRLPI